MRGSASIGPDGVVYVGSDDRKLYAFAPDGFKLWTYTTGGWIRSTPAVSSDGTIYVGSYDNSLHAISSAGLKSWEFATDSAISSSPALAANGAVYFGGWNKRFYAVKGGTGLAANVWAKFRGDARQTAAQLETSPLQFAQPHPRPAFPVEDPKAPAVTSQAAAAEEFARAQAAREQALAAKKSAAARTKAATVPAPVAPKQPDATAEAKRLAKLQAEADAQAARQAKAARQAQLKAETEANRKMLAENARVLKDAELARQAQTQADYRRALTAGELARKAKADASLRDAAARKAAEDADRQAKAQAEMTRKAEAAEAARKAAEAKAQTEADRRAAMETARQTKLQQEAERKAAAAKAQADQENQKRALQEAEQARQLQTADETRRAAQAADQARRAKKEADERATAARKAAETAARLAQAEQEKERKNQAAEAARQLTEAKAKAEAERKAAMETARQTKLQQEAAEAKAKAEQAAERKAAEASAQAAAETARLAKKEADQRAAAKRTAEAAELKAQQAAAARELAEAKAKAEQEAKAAAEIERIRAKEQEIARKVMADSERAAREERERQAREEARAQAAERRRIEAERQKWEPVSGGFFRRLFGAGSAVPAPPKSGSVATPEPTVVAVAPAAATSPKSTEAERKTAEQAEIEKSRQLLEESRRTLKLAEAARQAQAEAEKKEREQAARAQAAERRRLEAERQKWEPTPGGFFQRLFGGGSAPARPKPEAPAPAPAPIPVPVVTAPVPPPPSPVTAPVPATPGVPLKIISDSAELVRPAAPAAPPASFFTPAQPTVDPLADQIEMLKQRAAQAQVQPSFTPPVAPPVAVQPAVAEAAPVQSPANEEKPGFWSRVGSFFIRSKKDPSTQGAQSAQAPPRTVVQWPPNNIVVRDPKATQVPPGLAPGGVQATNFPRVQYARVTNQGSLFLPRALAAQTNLPGMPQPPAPPREVREMRPGKTNPQGLTDLQGNAPIELILGKSKAVLHVYATGPGRVSPDLNGAELDVGQTYTIEAQPSRGAVFLGWTGSIVTNTPILRFTLRTGTTLTANFQFAYNMEREVPEVAIQAPPDGARLTSPVFTVQGQARDNIAVARVEVSVNDGPWEPAQGTDTWVFPGIARPGANYVRVRAIDQAGNQSPPLLRSLYYSVPSTLTVRVNGAGVVEPDWHGRLLDVGGAYEVRATPAAGHVFTGWSGGVSGSSPLLQFTMQTNLVVEANFAPRLASQARGVFNGLVYPTNSLLPGKCGFFQLELAADGAFTGFLRQGNASHPLSGRFDVNGQTTATITRANQSPVTLKLQLDTAAGERLMGRFDDDGAAIELFGYRQIFDGRTTVSPLAGRYTFVMPSPTNNVNSPAGDAFGEIIVDPAGRVKVAGELPDGTPVRHEAVLGRNGIFPLHVPLAGGRGMLLGWVTVSQDPNLDAFGELIWHKPLTPQDRYYPGGFSTRRLLFGNLYTPTATAASSGHNIEGMLSGGNLDKIILGHGGVPITPGSPNYETLSRLTWNFRPDTGYVDGTFIHPATKQETAFRGALLQKRGWTSGYFLGQNSSGVVHLQLPQ